MTVYEFKFEDGTCGVCAGWSAWEKKARIAEHGKLVKYKRVRI